MNTDEEELKKLTNEQAWQKWGAAILVHEWNLRTVCRIAGRITPRPGDSRIVGAHNASITMLRDHWWNTRETTQNETIRFMLDIERQKVAWLTSPAR
jgi:hypothetical protein